MTEFLSFRIILFFYVMDIVQMKFVNWLGSFCDDYFDSFFPECNEISYFVFV